MNRQGRNIWSCVKKVCNAERISKKPCPFIALRAIHGRLAPYESAKINAEPFIALRAIHVGLAPNKSKIINSRKSINVLPAVIILSLLGL